MTKRQDPDRIMSHHQGRDLFPDFRWNAEKSERLKRLWEEGLSDSRIAGLIGCSRNAIIGKRKRSGLQHPEDLERNARARATGNGGGTVLRVKAKRTRIASAHTGGTTQRMNNKANGAVRDSGFYANMPRDASLAEFNAAIPSAQRVTIIDLTHETCRFPLWGDDDSSRFYCGHPSADITESRPFCASHQRFAYKPKTGAKPWLPGRP